MVMPYYVSPEQMMKDKAEFAETGIAKGRSIVIMKYNKGILLVADNPSLSLHKISEIYDNIAFAGAGKYNEFENLRKAGIRYADMKGYQYSREDVTAKELAHNYSQLLGTVFSQDTKPYEVEILVVRVGKNSTEDEIFRISYDGSIIDEDSFAVIGGDEPPIFEYLKEHHDDNRSINDALNTAVKGLEADTEKIPLKNLEVGILERDKAGRKFRRLMLGEFGEWLNTER